jgi:hypothetical protein
MTREVGSKESGWLPRPALDPPAVSRFVRLKIYSASLLPSFPLILLLPLHQVNVIDPLTLEDIAVPESGELVAGTPGLGTPILGPCDVGKTDISADADTSG